MPTIYIKDYDTEVDIPEGSDMVAVQAALQKQFPAKKQEQAPQPSPEAPAWAEKYPNLYGVAGAARETLGPVLEALGVGGGAILGSQGGINPMGGVAGAGLGWAGAKNLLESADVALGNKQGKTLKQQIHELPGEIATGEAMEVATPVAGYVLKPLGKAASQLLGATTGTGPGTIETAVKGGKVFTDAMRGKTAGDEVVENVKGAVSELANMRGAKYRAELAEITKNQGPINIEPLKQRALNYLKRFRVGINADETLNFSNSKLPKKAAADIEDIFTDIMRWDKDPSNITVEGMDVLKQRIGNYYSDNHAARAVIADLQNEVKKLIVQKVPKYGEMTKGYADATNLIKDLESTLMAGKKSKTDQTLRRLTSAMRENFEMRRDLVEVLGEKTGKDLAGQIAGYSASQWIPRGLVGKMSLGGGAGALAYLNPKLLPLLGASSPRIVGEFLNVYGKGLREAQKIAPATYRTIGLGMANSMEEPNE